MLHNKVLNYIKVLSLTFNMGQVALQGEKTTALGLHGVGGGGVDGFLAIVFTKGREMLLV